MEYRSYCNQPIELRKTPKGRKLVGYAVVYDSLSEDLGGYREIIKRGAFEQSLKEVAAGTRNVLARYNHQNGLNLLGSIHAGNLTLRDDEKGLLYEIDLLDTSVSNDVYVMAERGLINKSSFAFTLQENGDNLDLRGDVFIREVLKANLIDIAPVDMPAYQASSVSARSVLEAIAAKQMEELERQIKELEG